MLAIVAARMTAFAPLARQPIPRLWPIARTAFGAVAVPSAVALATVGALLLAPRPAAGQPVVLTDAVHLLRSGERPEWREFAARPHARRLSLVFTARRNAGEAALSFRQRDVKQRWRLVLNGRSLGTLHQDENAIVAYRPVPGGLLADGSNELVVEPEDTTADDIEVGAITLHDRPLGALYSEATLDVEVADAGSGRALPSRITVTDGEGRLVAAGAASGRDQAVRLGFVYTGSGRATIGLPAGVYTIYATRGFEYGVDSARVVLRAGDRVRRTLAIAREVPTRGWVSSDTHVHTLTYSGHGDATAAERVVTLAGEGIELPIVTDHNVHVDLDSVARAAGVREHFTPVIGNEVTTRVGHFNVFPVAARTPPPVPRADTWDATFRSIAAAEPRVVILNHARDVHAGFRPFAPERHIAVAGLRRDGWTLGANAMEVVNSGAQQTDPWRLFADWLGMLAGGHRLTPVGSSDSHDVARYIVGQARTYIRAPDDAPGRLDVDAVVERFRAGAVMVSFGLLAELTVAGSYGPGDLVPAARLRAEPRADSVLVAVRVLGPAWTRADRVTLYANGRPVRSARIAGGRAAGVKWSGAWRIPRPAHDVFLVAVAEGPGGRLPYWPVAKPYQPASPDWTPRVIGASGAVWLDADGDGAPTSPRAYAERLADSSGGTALAPGALGALVRRLASYDEAVAVQAAALLLERGTAPTDARLRAALRGAAPAVRRGFAAFAAEWRASEAARRRR